MRQLASHLSLASHRSPPRNYPLTCKLLLGFCAVFVLFAITMCALLSPRFNPVPCPPWCEFRDEMAGSDPPF